jgi:2-keto-myo-inositol isomerase
MAVEAVSDVDGWDAYELCFDTFQFFRCGDNAMHYDRIGLAHMSGISRPDLKPDELTEPDRGLVFIDDRVDNIGLLRNLVASGYSGFVSMEPFSPAVQNDPELLAHVRASLEYVSTLLKSKT